MVEVVSRAAAVTVSLDAVADPTSNFNAYWSEGLAQLNLTYSGTTRQPFWDTKDLSRTYTNSFDFFPNEAAMKFGNLTYDDASLVGGSGSATITGLTLGIERDPLDSGYVNGSWLSFTTDVQTYSGAVTVSNGVVTGINLTASYNATGSFGPTPVSGSGTFSVSGATFHVLASAHNPNFGNYNPSMAWNWSGVISSVVTAPPTLAADFDGNGHVDAADLAAWKIGMGIASGAEKDQGDANGDGAVDGADFLTWQREFGMGPPQTLSAVASVPEPSAALLLAMALGVASFGRRRSRCMRHR
jgi:hypothetical protein